MVIAKTGEGKSVPYLFLCTLLEKLNPLGGQLKHLIKVIVVMPFKALLKSTVEAAKALGFNAAWIGEDQDDQAVIR
jgi:superfamily II DNA helicase RecQ